MIKGVRIGGMGKALSYLDKLTVPIIDNTPFEEDLKDSMAAVRPIPGGWSVVFYHVSVKYSWVRIVLCRL